MKSSVLASRPRLDIPRSPLEVTLQLAAIIGTIFSIYIIWHYWTLLPERIPTHYGLSGEPNAWGGKGTLLILPSVTLFLFAMFTVLERFPRIYNYPVAITPANAERQYILARTLLGWLNFEIVWFFAFMEWKTIQIALRQASGLGPIAVIIFLVMTICSTIIYFSRARQAK